MGAAPDRHEVLIVGGGQAGLALGHSSPTRCW